MAAKKTSPTPTAPPTGGDAASTAWQNAAEQAAALRQKGENAAAEQAYAQACAQPEAPAQLWFNLGNVRMDLQRWTDALQAFEHALTLAPELDGAALQAARCAAKLNAHGPARDWFSKALRLQPENFSAWLEAGHLCRQEGQVQQMLGAYRHAIQVAPERWEGHLALARGLEESEQWEQAALAYDKAGVVALNKQADQAWRVHALMGRYRMERGDVPRGIEALRHALLVLQLHVPAAPSDARCEVLIDMGEALLRLGEKELAHQTWTEASSAQTVATLTRLAEVAYRFNLWEEAVEVLRINARLRPNDPTAALQLANTLAETWQIQEAQQILNDLEQAALARGEAPPSPIRMTRAQMASRMGDADTARLEYQALLQADPKQHKLRSMIAMSSLYSDQLSPEAVAQLHRDLYADMGHGARDRQSFGNVRNPSRLLRVGMVSADFHHQHPVNIFMQPVLREWAAAGRQTMGMELTMYFTGSSYDDQTHLARERVDRWLEVATLSDSLLHKQILKDRIDVLIDLAGHTGQHRMAVFAQRAAPVQLTFLGYPGSTGVPHIDWIVADPVVVPPKAEALYSEKVARLPGTVFCYAPEQDYPSPTWGPEHLQRPLTFGSFNNLTKVTPHTMRLWSQVLQALPESRLVLKSPSFKDESAIRRYQERFAALGVEAQRIDFRGPSALHDMMAEYGDIDIALDCMPYNGGTTSMQALWMGVPVVVQAGGHFVSRMGASFMTALGLPEWVAADDEAFVNIAVRMGRDRQGLLALKQGLRQRMQTTPAGDIAVYAREFAAMLRQIWVDFCQEKNASVATADAALV